MGYQLLIGDNRAQMRLLPAGGVQTCIASPPYFGLRDYGTAGVKWPAMKYVPMVGLPAVKVPAWFGELGSEPDPHMYIAHLVAVYAEVWRVLADDGTCWVNLGDSYATKPNGPALPKAVLQGAAPHAKLRSTHAKRSKGVPAGLKHKDLMMMPARLAMALQAAGWYLRNDIIWNKPNPMPESCKDRCTSAHEFVFLLTKRKKYYFDAAANREPSSGTTKASGASFKRENSKRSSTPGQKSGTHRPDRDDTIYADEDRNRRDVWTVATAPYPGAHFATFPADLVKPCVLAGSRPGDTVLDIFAGSGTTGEVALSFGREAILIDVQANYAPLIHDRLRRVQLDLFQQPKSTRTPVRPPAPVQMALPV